MWPANLVHFSFVLLSQSAASCRGSIYTSNHSGQLHSSSGAGGGTHCGGSLRAHCSHRCCSEACARRRGSCHRCSLWRVPANPHSQWLLPSAPARSPSPAAAGHLTELPGTAEALPFHHCDTDQTLGRNSIPILVVSLDLSVNFCVWGPDTVRTTTTNDTMLTITCTHKAVPFLFFFIPSTWLSLSSTLHWFCECIYI